MQPPVNTRHLFPVLDQHLITITGAGDGDWYLVMNKKWELSHTTDHVHAHTIIDGSVAWKLFTKSWRRNDVKDHVSVRGDQQVGSVILDMVAVMA